MRNCSSKALRFTGKAKSDKNSVAIGLFPHVEARLDLDLDSLRPGLVVADVIPNPPRTRLIRDAEAQATANYTRRR
jgi:shikimate 5-dehydrogenase